LIVLPFFSFHRLAGDCRKNLQFLHSLGNGSRDLQTIGS
jgi:hypothetical protein